MAQVFAPAFACTANAGVPPDVRAEGEAELVGDLVLDCTGGTPSTAGSTVPVATITLSFNTNVTSQIPASGFSEALLLIDEPHNQFVGSAPLLPCGAAGSNDKGSGVCSITSDGVVFDTYNGTPGHPNVFLGQASGANTIVWNNVPIDAPGSSFTRVIRFTNLRLNARLFGLPAVSAYTQLISYVTISGQSQITISNPQQLVAYGQNSLTQQTRGAVLLSQSSGANPSPQFLISLTETFPSVLKVSLVREICG
jgi:hypothetical protein